MIRLITYVQIILGGITGIHSAFDCRCPEVSPRPELGEFQYYCGKELKGLDCLPETVYKCKTFNQTIAEPPPRKIDDNCTHKRANWYCGPYSKKECEDDAECISIRRCFKSKVYVDKSMREWYAEVKKNRGRNETGPYDPSLNGTTENMQDDSI